MPHPSNSGGPVLRPLHPLALAASLDELWSPRVIADLDEHCVKVARLHGELDWHAHADEDELFLVLRGRLRLELEDGPVDLAEGELLVVPRGVRHRPVAEEECLVLLVERASTKHTGDAVTERTRSIEEQRRPLPDPER